MTLENLTLRPHSGLMLNVSADGSAELAEVSTEASVEASILATLAYSNIFDYPLTFAQLHENLIFKKISKKQLRLHLVKLIREGKVLNLANFYQLAQRRNLAKLRLLRAKFAQKKLEKARRAAKILSLIPQVKLVGISGALATKNTPKDDDIDFFVITSARMLFTTRFFCNLFLDLANLRRKPADKKIADKICLNMFLAESDLEIHPHDLYLAHEVLQLKPIFERDETYVKFLKENFWVAKFLPNWPKLANSNYQTANSRLDFYTILGKPLEFVLRKIQIWYMERRKTTEKVSATQLFFHPEDIHQKVLKEFGNRLKELKIPLEFTK